MPKSQRLQDILDQAEEKEKNYDWLKAAELYRQVLGSVGKGDFFRKGKIQERIGYCLYRGAFQAESQEEFKERMQLAIEVYEQADGFYDKLTDEQKAARMFRCDAMIAYMSYWVESEVPEKKKLIGECWRLAKEAMNAFKDVGDAVEYGKTCNELSLTAFLTYVFEWDFQVGQKIIEQAAACTEHAITLLSHVDDPRELARAYVKAVFYQTALDLYFVPDIDAKMARVEKGRDYWRKAYKLSEEAAFLEVARMPHSSGDEFGWSHDEAMENYEKALGYAKKTGDKYMIGTAMDWLAYGSHWEAFTTDDPDKRMKIAKTSLQYAENARHHFSSISFVSPHGDTMWIGAPHAAHYNLLVDWETNLKKKRNLLEKALREGFHELELAESTDYPRVIRHAHAALSSVLTSLALIETNSNEKRGLLEKALEHKNEVIRIAEQCYPFEYYNLGVHRVVTALTKGELSDFEKDPESRKNMLEEAISSVEHGLRLIIEDLRYWDKRGELVQFAPLGKFQYRYGEMVIRLYRLTNNVEHQKKAIKAFEVAAESFQKLNLFSRLAECHWKVARSYDALGEYLKAAEIFTLVSDNYRSAAQKIPQLKDFYQDYRCYMEAWREIEKAKHNHRQQEYGKAKEYYEKATDLHESTERWNYLGPNYLAWARLEEAEDLSRKEQTEEAQKLFQQAATLFTEAKESIQTKLKTMEVGDEREMAAELVKASDIRRDYCLGRSALEEAKILDRQGDHAASSTKYGDAAEKFRKATNATKDELDRRELRPIVFLCQAWQTMTQAEAEVSPDLYLEASQLFDTAKEHSLDEKAKMLALGHSSFCKALEAGTRFETTKDATSYSTAKKHIEAATNQYLKAGFRNASEYARATYRLFDAYMYMYKAQTETDPGKKAQYYQMAEKLLQASAGSFMKAKHPEKSEEVGRLLESVKEERELTLSLAQVLHVPTIASTTASFSTPTPTHEHAVGLDRFEHADIQANLILTVKEVTVGEDVDFKMELVNAGKAPALLIKVDEVIPQGFEIKEVPEIYTFEDSFINMKGKRLNPLKTEDVKVVVNPRSKGTFIVKPRVLYIDETGMYKSHEPEPVTITVKELGIKGWIKGER